MNSIGIYFANSVNIYLNKERTEVLNKFFLYNCSDSRDGVENLIHPCFLNICRVLTSQTSLRRSLAFNFLFVIIFAFISFKKVEASGINCYDLTLLRYLHFWTYLNLHLLIVPILYFCPHQSVPALYTPLVLGFCHSQNFPCLSLSPE